MPSAFRRSIGTNRKKGSTSGIAEQSVTESQSAPSLSSPSNFNRTPAAKKGVKPWHGSTYLTSVGLSDLDNILGGGQLLGTSILLEEDRLWSRDLALTLVKYWCAEAISQDQDLIIPTFSNSSLPDMSEDGDDKSSLPLFIRDDWSGDEDQPWRDLSNELHNLLLALPRNLHWDKQKKKEEKAMREKEASEAAAAATADITSGLGGMGLGSMAILEEGEEEEDQKAEDGLEVAWQYKKSVQKERLAKAKSSTVSATIGTDVFCHSYDLSARMKDQIPLDPFSYISDLPSISKGRSDDRSYTNGYALFRDLVQLLKERSSPKNDKAVRLLLYHPPLETLSTTLPLLLAHIRKYDMSVVILIIHAPTADLKSKIRLGRSCDVVLSTEGFASRREYPPPAEFRHLLGVLKIAKTTRKRTEVAASIYGFKRDRRKLHIPLLHIPPEDYAEGGGSVGGGGVRSGAGRPSSSKPEGGIATKKSSGGMGCSSNMSGSLLDF